MSARSDNYYDLFCLAPQANPAELKLAYRRLIRLHHPDLAGARGEAMTKRINAAWSVLSDPTRRRAYDLSLRQPTLERPAPRPPTAAPSASPAAPWRSASPPAASARPGPGPASAPSSRAPHRVWALSWAVLLTALVCTMLVLQSEWASPTDTATAWWILPLLAVPSAVFVYLSRRPYRMRLGFFLWFCALIYPLTLLEWQPFAAIGAGFTPDVLVGMTALAPLVYLTRLARRRKRRTVSGVTGARRASRG